MIGYKGKWSFPEGPHWSDWIYGNLKGKARVAPFSLLGTGNTLFEAICQPGN